MERQLLEKFRRTPEAQRLLDTVSFAEGTNRDNLADSYRVMYGGGLAKDLTRHPDTVIHGGRYSSAAAGRYQFMPGTWERTASRLGLKTFGQTEQDLAALKLARDRLLPIGGLSVLQKEGLSPRVSNLLAPEWASFPTTEGVSYYGQPVKSYSELDKFYRNVKADPTPEIAAPQPVGEGDTAPQKNRGMEFLRNYLHFLPGFGSSMPDQSSSTTNASQMLAKAFQAPQIME